jgi:hypothetical protein
MRLLRAHKHVLLAMVRGDALKSHRDVDGHKTYRLHPLAGHAEDVSPATVAYLSDHGLIGSNQKFPSATYWLTDKARQLAILHRAA